MVCWRVVVSSFAGPILGVSLGVGFGVTVVAQQPADAAAMRQQLPAEIWTVRHDNQTGQHENAAQRAERLLQAKVGSVVQRCDLWLHLAFARQKLRRADATQAFRSFAEAARELDADDPLRIEMRLLRAALGLPPLPGLAAAGDPFEPPANDSYWQPRDPATSPYDDATREELVELARRSGADGLLVTRKGRIEVEFYSPLYREPMPTMSSCKSITGLLAGILVDRGALQIDARVSEYLPEWAEGRRGDVTVRHLLTMTAGLPRRSQVERRPDDSWTDFARRQEVVRQPGEKFEYTNEGVQLLSPILEHAAGTSLAEFAKAALFEPIGATNTAMRRLRGATNTYADAATTLREFARFGELVRRRGEWPGHGRVVSEAWLDQMLAASPQNGGYGLLWWREPDGRGWSMRGYLDTDVWVFPALDVVVARVQHRAYLHVREPFDDERMYRLLAGR